MIDMAKKEVNPDTWEQHAAGSNPASDIETIPNNERGCGYLKAGNAYIRCDPSAFSSSGTLAGFVAITTETGELAPVPYKESLPRGYESLAGTNFMAAAEPHRHFTPLYPGDRDATESHAEAHQRALENMVEAGLYDSLDAAPASELSRHLDRMAHDGFDGDHWGTITPANSKDLLMRVGKSYYPDPWDFIEEVLELGLNKGISVHDNKSPPVIQPGRTRCWLIHPNACGDGMPGVIGFCYLTRTIFTLDSDGQVPKYAEDYAQSGKLDVVDIGKPQPQPEDGDESRDYDAIADKHQSLSEFDVGEAREAGHTPAKSDPDAGEIGAALTGTASQSNIAPQEIEDMAKASLGELVGEGWVFAEHPPEAHDVLDGGGLLGIIRQDGAKRKVSASNNWKFDTDTQQGNTRLGPYTVQMELSTAGRQIKVDQ